MQCEQVLRDEIGERYLRGALSEADQEAFEHHYFECESCTDKLENLRLLRQALMHGAPAGEARSGVRAAWARLTLAAAAMVALVAGGLYLRYARSNGPPEGPGNGTTRLVEQQPAVRVPPAPEAHSPPVPAAASSAQSQQAAPSVAAGAALSSALAALAIVQAPPYTPAILRGALDESARRFQEAMRLYVRKDYEGARAGLRAAAALDQEASDIAFFLGICALLTDEPAAAIAELRRTVDLGESPYLEEAHFYLAKAHVRRGELAAAASQLEATIRLRGEREQEAREMLQKLESLRRTLP